MSLIATLDVLIVYNGNIVASPSDYLASTPFHAGTSNESCNDAYAYFLATCAALNLRIGFCSSSDIIGAGSCSSYWTYADSIWHKNLIPCKSKQIFDKFSPKTLSTLALRARLFSSPRIKSFNSFSLFKLFFDKQKTHDALPDFTIPTLTMSSRTLPAIQKTCSAMIELIKSHPHRSDFSDQIILKDRFGAGGRHIYKVDSLAYKSIQNILKANPHVSFVIQPLIKFDRGFKYHNRFVSTDIRLIYLKGKIVSSYLRMAQAGDFRCNQHQGGSLSYLPQSAIPKAVTSLSRTIATLLNKKSSLFTLDFLLSNTGHAYLLEGNTGPGLNWNPNDQIDQKESKKLVRRIVKELKLRIKPKQSISLHDRPKHSLTSASQSATIMV